MTHIINMELILLKVTQMIFFGGIKTVITTGSAAPLKVQRARRGDNLVFPSSGPVMISLSCIWADVPRGLIITSSTKTKAAALRRWRFQAEAARSRLSDQIIFVAQAV